MALTINKLIIDRPIRGMMMSNSGDILWSVNDFKDPHLTATTEQQQAVDALNTPIMEFDRAKTVEFTATNAGFDLGLLAARAGIAKKVASSTEEIRVPKWETVKVDASTNEITLKKTVANANDVPYLFELTEDGSTSYKWTQDASDTDLTARKFTFANNKVTLPTHTGISYTFLIPYEYVADGTEGTGEAIVVDYSANNFPKAGKFVMSVLCHDICDSETEYFAWMIMDNAKLNSDIDLTLNPEMTDDFTIKAMPKYCSEDKRCFRIIVPNADELL